MSSFNRREVKILSLILIDSSASGWTVKRFVTSLQESLGDNTTEDQVRYAIRRLSEKRIIAYDGRWYISMKPRDLHNLSSDKKVTDGANSDLWKKITDHITPLLQDDPLAAYSIIKDRVLEAINNGR